MWWCATVLGHRHSQNKKEKLFVSFFAKCGTVENKVNAVHALVKFVSQKHTS